MLERFMAGILARTRPSRAARIGLRVNDIARDGRVLINTVLTRPPPRSGGS
jgi:hypothetical protein